MFIGGSFVLPITGNPLRRIFSRGSWNMHGRAYAWFQSIPKTARSSMTMDGEPVAECDYSALHPTILYNKVGIAFDGYAYDVDGFETAEIKAGFNIALNAKNDRAAIAALANKLDCSRGYADNIITSLKRRHRPIERYFCTDAGIKLMRTDSELILTALKIVNDAGHVALPVHDALIVPTRATHHAEAAMRQSFEQIVGRASPCIIKTKGANVPHMGERPGLSSPSLLPPPARTGTVDSILPFCHS
jgi:hypothetical protein